MSKDRVSRMCAELDETSSSSASGRSKVHPYLWLDAKHVKVRDRGRKPAPPERSRS